jgi:hypothetical protein
MNNKIKIICIFRLKIRIMAKKIIITCLLICLLTGSIFAQLRVGPVGGLNFNRQVYKSNSYRYEGIFRTQIGFNVGVLTDLILSKHFSLQSELIYTLRGGYYKTDRYNVSEEYNADMGYISLPVCLTGKIDVKSAYIIFGAGPYLEKLMHAQHKFYSNGKNIENGKLRVGTNYTTDQLKPWNAGLKVKAGFELKKGMYMVAFYDIGTSDINPQFTVTRNKTFGLQIAYLFSTSEEDRYERFEKFYEF